MFNVLEKLGNLKNWFLRERARFALRMRYEYLLQNNILLEEFDTYRILEFDENQRNSDLVKIQKENEQMIILIEFLKNVNKIKKSKQ